MQAVTTSVEALALGLLLLAVVLAWIPSRYVASAALCVAAVSLLVLSWGLSRIPSTPRADGR